MKRSAVFLPAMLLVVGVETSLALPVAGGQTPEAQDRGRAVHVAWADLEARRGEVEAPRVMAREDGVTALRARELQAPRADEVQAPRGDDVQAPRADKLEAPRAAELQAPRAGQAREPRWRED